MDDKFYKRNLNDETGTILWKLYEDSRIKWANEFEKSGCIALQTETGEEKHIEVKTTSGNSDKILDFYLTDNELQKMKLDSNYYIYYLFDIKNKPKLHIINKEALLNHEKDYLMPVAYKIMIDVQKNNPI